MSEIQHFMWGYQQHYRIYAENLAEKTLRKLDNQLDPEVFLVGVHPDPDPEKYRSCVEPEEDYWIESEAFERVPEVAVPIRQGYPENQLIHSHPVAQERQNDKLYRRSLRDAVLEVIGAYPNKPQGLSFFVSIPEIVNGYLVSVVLSVGTNVLDSYCRLATDSVPLHDYRRIPVCRSLLDAVISELLFEFADCLLRPDPGLRTGSREADEIIRSAARRLARDITLRADPHGVEGMYQFFETITSVASMRYERAEGRGKLLVARKEHPSLRKIITFPEDVSLYEHRRVRKLLELTSGRNALHVNGSKMFGLVEEEVLDEKTEDIFKILVLGHHHWELAYAGRVLMGVLYGEPYLPRVAEYESRLREDLPRLFSGMSEESCELLVSLVRQAERERHGTLLVISQNAEVEAARLVGQATPVERCKLNNTLLEDLTAIDGAVLVDPQGYCYAIGVILDGLAIEQGDAARGARFNSAVRYVASALERRIPTLAVVVSEDGGVDLVPKLRPKINRCVLDNFVDELEDISRRERIPLRRYNDIFDWLRSHSFYLLDEDCRRINAAVDAIERKLDNEDPGRIRIVREVLRPDPNMDQSFYYHEQEGD